jgi:acyl-CoA synthetase (NDP forming)/GNAT superfamily N-acetyltransferase
VAAYPRELERPGLLRDGRSLLIRPARQDDLERLLAFNSGLSRRTVSYRMLGPVVRLDRRAAEAFLELDYHDRLALVAVHDELIIGLAEYSRLSEQPDRATIAFTVDDAYQGVGLGGLLLEHLAAAARDRGVAVFEADVLAENDRMLRTFASSGYQVEMSEPASVQHVDIAVDPRRQVIRRSDRRERAATRPSLQPLFTPRSVAVIGANRERRTVGHAILRNLVEHGFTGPVHAVNPNATEIEGIPSVASIADVPGPVDLAVVAVPAGAVPDVLRECGVSGVNAAVVVTTGVADGQTSVSRDDLLGLARGHGMRLVGPNCMGLINLDPGTSMVATFSPTVPRPGGVSMASQSGPLGLAVLDHAERIGLGFSQFVSLGDSIDVSPSDLLTWWESDRSTSVVLLHLEQFGNPRKFGRTARRVAARKPVIAVQAGTAEPVGTPGRRSQRFLPADSDAAMSALFTQAGVIRTRTLQEMFDTALLLASQPVPAGRRVAVVTNAGGPGALTVGACRAAGLELAALCEPTTRALRALLGPDVEWGNPVDLTPMAVAGDYRAAMTAVLADRNVDAVIALFIPPLVDEADAVADALLTTSAAEPGKPVVASFLGLSGLPAELSRDGRRLPSYLFPEAAATALGHAADYGEWVRRPAGLLRDPQGIDVEAAREIVERHCPGELDGATAAELLGCFGLASTASGHTPPAVGQDITVGVVSDPIFGPVIAFGMAGDYAQVFGDVALGLTPISDLDAAAMVRAIRAVRLLEGFGNRPAVDLEAAADAILRISTLVERVPEIAELTVERMRLGPPGSSAVLLDAAIKLTTPPPDRLAREATVEV